MDFGDGGWAVLLLGRCQACFDHITVVMVSWAHRGPYHTNTPTDLLRPWEKARPRDGSGRTSKRPLWGC